MHQKLMLGISGYRSLTRDIVQKSPSATRIFPMDFYFDNRSRGQAITEIVKGRARVADRGKRSKLKQIQRFLLDEGENTYIKSTN